MKILKYGLLVATMYLFNGCVGQPSIPKVEEAEVGTYEKAYIDEYNKIASIEKKEYTKWIQAANKKEDCKLFIGYDPNDDRTQKIDYKIFWDGECRNGYAYGLGREFEKGLLTDIEAIGVYDGTEKEPEYYYQNFKLNNLTEEGNLNDGYVVQTMIKEDGMNFDINFRNIYEDKKSSIVYIIENSPFSDNVVFVKAYPNFAYIITDFTNNEFENRKYQFDVKDIKNNQFNGYGFITPKYGQTIGGEFQNNSLIRYVLLPESYFNNAYKIFSEIKNAAQKVQREQQKASMIKIQYKNKICKDSVKVDFMDNKEYKAICKEDEKIAQLKTKIDAKLAQIEQQKQAKRQQQNEQRLIQAREAEAIAAQRRAAAAEQANNQAAWDSVNRSIQNMNNNIQMQQLNNNLMMYNFMPKRYDVYLH